MKRIAGLIGMVLSFAVTVVFGLVLVFGKGAQTSGPYLVFLSAVIILVLSFLMFRKAKPIESTALSEDHKAAQEFQKNMPKHHYYVSGALSFLLLSVYGLLVATKNISFIPTTIELYSVGAGFGEDVAHGQIWRLFTQIFLHGSVGHLISNIIGLIAGGRLLDYVAGKKNLLAIFVVGGLFASLASSIYNPTVVSVGASGAIFAIYGAIFSSYFFNPKMREIKVPGSIWLSAAFQALDSISYGLSHAGVDNAAHIGGLVAGFGLMSMAYRFTSETEDRSPRVFAGATAVVALFVFAVMPLIVKQQSGNPLAHSQKIDSVIAAIDAIEKAEVELDTQRKQVTPENRVEKTNWAVDVFMPKFQKAITTLKEIDTTGLNEKIVSLKNSVQDSAASCAELYQISMRLERNPASVDKDELHNLQNVCVTKMKQRYQLARDLDLMPGK
jgi:membrane associated rhomboid family serine protease